MIFTALLFVSIIFTGVFALGKTLNIDGVVIAADVDTGVVRHCYLDCTILEDDLPFQIKLEAEDFELMDNVFLSVSYMF